MADKAISELIAAEQITPTDKFVLEQNGTAKQLSGQVLLNWLTAAADGHGGIKSIAKVGTSGLVDTYRITLADTTTFDYTVDNGKGISEIKKESTSGLVDTYSIAYTDGTTGSFKVTNGAKGDPGDNTYTWIKYASQKPTASSHSFGDEPDSWIGIYFGELAAAPTDWTKYSWYRIAGEPGKDGVTPHIGSNKHWYIGNQDTGIIAEGTDGEDGVDGLTPHIGKNGNWFLGDTDTRKPSVGDPTDEVIQKVIAALGTPVFGTVDAYNNILLSGNLADGTYTLRYEYPSGNVVDIGTLVKSTADFGYTNQIPISTDTNGQVFNGTGYETGSRCSSSGAVSSVTNPSAENAPFVTGFIPCKQGDIIRMKNCYIHAFNGDGTSEMGVQYGGDGAWALRSGLYDSGKNNLAVFSWGNLSANGDVDKISYEYDGLDFKLNEFTVVYPGTAYIRLTLAADGDPADAIVTVNQKIT